MTEEKAEERQDEQRPEGEKRQPENRWFRLDSGPGLDQGRLAGDPEETK